MATSRAFGYYRVSTDQQSESGLGLEAQRQHVATAAVRLGLQMADDFTDAGISGAAKLEQRPALLAATDALRRGDVLLVAKRDRLGRDVLNVAMIERLVQRKGARIVSAAGEGTDSNGPADILMRQMLDAFAQFERALIGARTKAALKAKRARGYRAGTVPYGFTADAHGRLSPDATERAVLSRIADLRAGGVTFRDVAARLNAEGHTTRRGTRWQHEYVARLMATRAEAA